jgi:hypothetical protein
VVPASGGAKSVSDARVTNVSGVKAVGRSSAVAPGKSNPAANNSDLAAAVGKKAKKAKKEKKMKY